MMTTPPRKVVLDSDDEEETSPQLLPRKGFNPIKYDTSYPTSNPPHHSEDLSTGSTVRLSREIQDATKKLLDPTPDGTRSTGKSYSSSEQPDSSPAVSKLRRATTNFDEGNEKKVVKTYGKQIQDDSVVGKKSGARVEAEPPSRKKVRAAAEFQDQQDKGSHIDHRTLGPLPSLPPSLSKGFKNTQNFESCMIVTGQNHSPSNLSKIHVSTSSEIIESTDLPQTPTKLGNPRRELEELKQNQPSLPNSVSEPPQKRCRLGNDDDTVYSSQDQLSMSSPRVVATGKTLRTEKAQKKVNVMDEIAIGLPLEQYNPRPSRSRSGHGDASLFIPEDFSKRPESLAKLKRRKNRRKTTAFERPPEDSEEEAIAQVRDFIRQEASSKPATDIVKPSLKPIEEQLRELQGVEPMKKVATTKRKGRHQVQENIEEYEPVVAPFSEEQPSKGISSTANGRKDVQEHDLSKIIETEKPPPKHQSLLEIETAQLIPMQTSSSRPASMKRKFSISATPHDGDDGGVPTCSDRPVSQNSQNVPPPQQNPTPSSSPSPIKEQLRPPQTPPKPASTGPDKHSPLNSSKVAYRVGLSRRARIEPLLRIVRKP